MDFRMWYLQRVLNMERLYPQPISFRAHRLPGSKTDGMRQMLHEALISQKAESQENPSPSARTFATPLLGKQRAGLDKGNSYEIC